MDHLFLLMMFSEVLKSGTGAATGDNVCGTQFTRRNINTLIPEERQSLVKAMQAAIASKEFQAVGDFLFCFASRGTICNTSGTPEFCCPDASRVQDFLPWHRLLMVHMEEVLKTNLPYWDWTEDSRVPLQLQEPDLLELAPVAISTPGRSQDWLVGIGGRPPRCSSSRDPNFIRRGSNIT